MRLCSLLPGKFGDQVRLTVKTHLLTPEDHPHYEALSYVCGSPEKPEKAIISDNNASLQSQLSLTSNLAEALQYVRYEDRSRTLWVDAVCINQDDLVERGAQILKMASIYRLASRVMIWLGPEKDDSAYAFSFTCDIGSRIRLEPNDTAVHSLDSTMPSHEFQLQLQSTFGESRLREALRSLFDRYYFERLWVRQEAFFGGESALIQCGNKIDLWSHFKRGAFAWAFSAIEDSKGSYCVASMSLNMLRQDAHIVGLLWSTRSTKCLDPRDKVFAILGMADPGKFPAVASIMPDLHKSVCEVYAQVFQACVRDCGSLILMTEAGVSRSSAWRPTWSPNWDQDADECLAATGYADAGAACNKECIDGLMMHAEGRIADTVARVEQADAGELDVRVFLEQVLADVDLQAPYFGGGDMLTAYAWVVTGGNIDEGSDSSRSEHLPLEDVRSILRTIKSRHHIDEYSSNLDGIHNQLENRCVITTNTGLVGVAPKSARPGDAVAIILGCPQPMLLMPCDGKMKVLGDCYVHGLNWGEALLGPLPEGTRVMQKVKHGSVHKCVTEAGDEHPQDPRISWRELEIDLDQANEYKVSFVDVKIEVYSSIHTTETRCWRVPDAAYFRNHGVELETITLI